MMNIYIYIYIYIYKQDQRIAPIVPMELPKVKRRKTIPQQSVN